MSAPTKKSDSITLRIDPETKAQLEALAEADDRPLSAFILKALRDRYGIKPPGKPKVTKAK
jgi:predicted transcriptional regulator